MLPDCAFEPIKIEGSGLVIHLDQQKKYLGPLLARKVQIYIPHYYSNEHVIERLRGFLENHDPTR